MFTYTFFSQPSPLWEEVIAVRMKIFVHEMQVPSDLELDNYDADATHLCVQDGARTMGTLRLIVTNDKVKVGRFALDKAYRRQGVGTQMMHKVDTWCQQKAIYQLYLDAQTYVIPFYKTLGFVEQGDVFIDAGIPHIRMTRLLAKTEFL